MPSDPTANSPRYRQDLFVAAALFLALWYVFWSSPNLYIGDSKYSMLLSQNLLTRHSFVLDGYAIPRRPAVRSGGADLDGDMYQIEIVDGHLYHYFPPGTSLLSLPFVALMDARGHPVVRADGTYNPRNDERVQRWSASWLMAVLTAVFYLTARLRLPMTWSVVIALGAALGTQIWSTASRAMWGHTWGVLLLGGVLYLLLARETGRHRRLPPVLLASLLSWMYFVRPTSSVCIVGVSVYVLCFHRGVFLPYALTGAAWFAAFVGYSGRLFGKPLPSYYQANRLEFTHFWEALAGNLVSPSRGLLVYVPVVPFVAYLVVRHREQQRFPRLVWLALAMGAGHLVVVASFSPWFGGVCFGPRYTTELVPWLVLVGILGLDAMRRPREEGRGREERWGRSAPAAWRDPALACGGALLLAGVFVHGRGACSPSTVRWNGAPVVIDEAPWRVWDWRYPQFLAGLVRPPRPAVPPRLEAGQRVVFGGGAGAPFQFEGWAGRDEEFCWTVEREATLVFAAAAQTPGTCLRLKFGAYLARDKLTEQTVNVSLNGRGIGSLSTRDREPHEYTLPLPDGTLRPENLLTFQVPHATSPKSLGDGGDERRLGIALFWLELNPPAEPSAATTGSDQHEGRTR